MRVHDKSIFRQLVHNSQILFLNSSKMLKDNVMSMENILLALKNQEEFDFNNEKITDVLNSIEQETKIKMKSFFLIYLLIVKLVLENIHIANL